MLYVSNQSIMFMVMKLKHSMFHWSLSFLRDPGWAATGPSTTSRWRHRPALVCLAYRLRSAGTGETLWGVKGSKAQGRGAFSLSQGSQ